MKRSEEETRAILVPKKFIIAIFFLHFLKETRTLLFTAPYD